MKKNISNLDKSVMANPDGVVCHEGIWRSEHSAQSYDLWGGGEVNEILNQIYYWPYPQNCSFPLWPYYFIENRRCDRMWYRHFNLPSLSMTLMLEGYIEYSEDNTVTVTGPGEMMIQKPGSSHRQINADDAPTHKLVLLFQGWGKGLFAETPELDKSGKVILKNSSIIEKKMRRIGKMIKQKKENSEYQLAEMACSLYLEVLRQQQKNSLPGPLAKICRFMESKNFIVDDVGLLAGEGGISRSTLLRLFRKYFDSTPHAYMLSRSLERGLALLRLGHNVKETAQQCGFADAGHFSRAFRKKYGLSPVEYRQLP